MRTALFIVLMVALAVLGSVCPTRAQTCAFDAQGRLTLVRYSSTQTIAYAYDADGNLTNQVVTGSLAEPDTDTDTLPDAWEYVYFNTLTNTASGDYNKDGLNNLTHYQRGTDPTDPDPDRDGMVNGDENIAGTSPTNAQSCLVMENPPKAASGTNGVLVEWQSVSGKVYLLTRSTNLMSASAFLEVRSNIVGQGISTIYTDAPAGVRGPWIYRVIVQP